MKQFRRSDRLNSQILRDISQLLDGKLAEVANGITTFTAVRLSADLRYAKVYYSYLGDEEGRTKIEEYLLRQRKRIRSQVGRNLNIRHIPEFDFKFDPSVEQGIKIERLLNEVRRDWQED